MKGKVFFNAFGKTLKHIVAIQKYFISVSLTKLFFFSNVVMLEVLFALCEMALLQVLHFIVSLSFSVNLSQTFDHLLRSAIFHEVSLLTCIVDVLHNK